MATTWNPADKGAQITLSNGNLTAEAVNWPTYQSVRATESKSSGKWYWEAYVDNKAYQVLVGVANSSANVSARAGSDANGWVYKSLNGDKFNNNVSTAYGATFTTGDIIGVALNLDTGKIWFAKNNVWQASGDPAAGTNEAFSGLSGSLYPFGGCDKGSPPNDKQTIRPDSASQSYSPPSGFEVFDEPTSSTPFLDGKLSINSPTNLLDGKTRVKDVTINDLDGKVRVRDVTTDLLDGKIRVKDSIANLLDGKVAIKDSTTNLLDGKVYIEGLSYNNLDGKVWVKEVIEGGIELPLLDILGNTGAIGDVTLPFLEAFGEASVGVDAQGNVTLPGLGVIGFTGAKCNYNLPSLGISGTSVVGTVASGKVVLPIFTIEGKSFTDAIVNGNIALPALRINASSIHGSLCVGEVSLPSLRVNATAKVGVVCTGEVTLPCLIIEGEGGHIPIGNGDVILPLLQVYSTASILADPREGCHILRHHRGR
jgi:hypothetical protein